MGAQFTIPLVTVIPGQLIASSLWNNEFNNINTNFVPAGMDSYSDTDAQMQIQTNPFPGGVTSHATSLGGELERLRFQFALAFGMTYWYNNPTASSPTFGTLTASTITANGANPAFVVSLSGVPQAQFGVNASEAVIYFGGTSTALLFNIINTSTSVFILSSTAATLFVPLNANSNKITSLTQGTNPGEAICFPVGTAQIAASAITAAQLGSVTGQGLNGGNGSVIAAALDGTTLDFNGSQQIEVKSNGITTTQILAGAVANSNTATTGSFSWPNLGHTPTTVMTTTITTLTGTPVLVSVSGRLSLTADSGAAIRILRGSTVIYYQTFSTGNYFSIVVPDVPGAGSQTYSLAVEGVGNSPAVTTASTNLTMTSVELRR